MMIGVRIIGLTAVGIPTRNLLPGASSICAEMQIHAAANYMIWIRRVHGNGVAVGHLPLTGKMCAAHALPRIATVTTAEDPKDTTAIGGGLGVEDIGIRRRDRQRSPVDVCGLWQTGGQLCPGRAGIRGSPDAVADATRSKRRVDRSRLSRMEN